MLSRLIRASLLLLGTAAASTAQVNLNFSMPGSGVAGTTVDNVFGTGFPAGAISPANLNVSLSTSCAGAPVVAVTPYSINRISDTMRYISFPLPATLQAGTYWMSVQGTAASGTAFTTSNCAGILVMSSKGFVKVKDGRLNLDGKPFRFSGGNLAGLKNSSPSDTDQMLQLAATNQLQVLRLWTFIDIGNQDGSNSVDGIENGYYSQYWNGSAPAFNDGATGLQNLDYAVSQAGAHGFKIILTLTNNWAPGGGMDQYVRWAGDTHHDDFYTDPKIRGWYEAWVSHLLNHVNFYTGMAYKDDPAILTWELANEPRCQGTGGYPASNSCSTSSLSTWVANESAFIKTIDHNHLVAVGDEGFFCTQGSTDPANGCSSGDDAVAFAQAPGIDLVTLHIYTQASSTDPTFSIDYINQHIQLGETLGKPTYVGEYGLQTGNQRNAIYRAWQQDVLSKPTAAGLLVWSLAGGTPGPIAAEAEEALDLHTGAPLLQTIRNSAQEAAAGRTLRFDPVADNQWATTTLNTAVPLNPLQNVVAYGGTTVDPGSLNLNPGGPQQSSVHAYGGQFTASGASVLFTPDTDFNGQAVAPFTVRDSKNNLSNTAYLFAKVNPTGNVTWEIESFETGADGWQATGMTTSQSTLFATNGPHSLKVVATQSGWFGIQFSSPLNLVNRPALSLDIVNTGASASSDMVIQAGENWQWCQSNAWPWLATNSPATVTMPLTAAGTGCANVDLTQVKAVYVYLAAGNTYYIDNVHAAAVPDNLLPVSLASFEDGTDGFAAQSGSGTVARSTTYYTDGKYGLQVTWTGGGGWFGNAKLGTLDLSSKTGIAYDIDTPNNGTSVNMQLGLGTQQHGMHRHQLGLGRQRQLHADHPLQHPELHAGPDPGPRHLALLQRRNVLHRQRKGAVDSRSRKWREGGADPAEWWVCLSFMHGTLDLLIGASPLPRPALESRLAAFRFATVSAWLVEGLVEGLSSASPAVLKENFGSIRSANLVGLRFCSKVCTSAHTA